MCLDTIHMMVELCVYDRMMTTSHKCPSFIDETVFHIVVSKKSFGHHLVGLLCWVSPWLFENKHMTFSISTYSLWAKWSMHRFTLSLYVRIIKSNEMNSNLSMWTINTPLILVIYECYPLLLSEESCTWYTLPFPHIYNFSDHEAMCFTAAPQ